jgi:hypothetical protein
VEDQVKEREYWYRVETRPGDGMTRFGDVLGFSVDLRLFEYPVLSHTPKGVWLDNFGQRKFVLNDSRKRYAYPTQEAALEAFKHRKRRQIGILSARLKDAQDGLTLAEKFGLEAVKPLRSDFIHWEFRGAYR